MTSPIKTSFKSEWFALLIIIVGFGAGAYFYQHFPARVATHWDFQGQPNGFSSRGVGAFSIPAVILAMYLLFLGIPYLDPRKERYAEFASTYHTFKDLIIAFLFIMFLLTGLVGIGYSINIGFWVPIMIGILFAVLGFMMQRIKMNWFIGIRTPWTLSSETVWNKTHEAAGPIFAAAGIIMAATAFVPGVWKAVLLIVSICVLALGLPVYSYLLYAREKKEKK